MNWWQIDSDEVFRQTDSSDGGLSEVIAQRRLIESGPNELQVGKRKSAAQIFFNQFKDFMILVLLIAAVISGLAGDLTDMIVIAVIVVLNAIIGFFQENKAERALEALKKISALQVNVIRNGLVVSIPSAHLVMGDLVIMEAGNIVSADIRLIEAHGLRINESALTGESVSVEKETTVIDEANLPIGDRLNMAYKSTLVTNGRAKGIVVGTGMKTEIGAIAGLLQQPEETTPLQKRMADFSKKLSYLVIVICVVFFGVGYLTNKEPVTLLLTSVSLAVAAIPEALPALITVSLAGGARRMAKKNALIRKLSAVETLGSVTFICTDKTGTLTQNKMTVSRVEDDSTDEKLFKGLSILESAIALNQDVRKDGNGSLIGDPTEVALVEHFVVNHPAAEWEELIHEMPREAEFPFDSERKCMTTIHRYGNQFLVVTKGAVESVMQALKVEQDSNGIMNRANLLSAGGMRVIAYGYKVVDSPAEVLDARSAERDLIFAGLVAMIDPPRREVKRAIEECKTAGIHVVMITGDHLATAAAIATQIGILAPGDISITGKDLQAMPEDVFEMKVEKIRVYARVSPDQKLRIVKVLQRKGHFVSMTGDGVNDAPSLKASDIGVAMGISGTDVSKEAANMILMDDNFATIVNAVKEGRHIYDNIRKFVKYIMTCNSAEICSMFFSQFLGLPLPLLPIQILWINLVTDGLPGLALAGEKVEKDIMRRPPRKTNESLFADGVGLHIVWVGLLMTFVTLGTQALAIKANNDHWQTMVFSVLSFSQLVHVMAIRSDRQFLHKIGIFSNLPLLGSVVLTFALQLVVIYSPAANAIFKTQPLTTLELATCMILSLTILLAVEAEKAIRQKNLNLIGGLDLIHSSLKRILSGKYS